MKSITSLFTLILLFCAIPLLAQQKEVEPDHLNINRDSIALKALFYPCNDICNSATVILLHGFPGGNGDVFGLGKKFSQNGMNALTFSYSGTHQSGGEWSFENTLKDIERIYNFIHQPEIINKYKIDTNRIYLGGYSYGGGMALSYGIGHPEIEIIFSIAGTDHGEFMREYINNPRMREMIDPLFESYAVPNGHVRFVKMPKDIMKNGIGNMNYVLFLKENAAALAPKNILLIGGWDDNRITIDRFILPLYRELQKERAKNVRIVAFQDDHSFRNSRSLVAENILEWLKNLNRR